MIVSETSVCIRRLRVCPECVSVEYELDQSVCQLTENGTSVCMCFSLEQGSQFRSRTTKQEECLMARCLCLLHKKHPTFQVESCWLFLQRPAVIVGSVVDRVSQRLAFSPTALDSPRE